MGFGAVSIRHRLARKEQLKQWSLPLHAIPEDHSFREFFPEGSVRGAKLNTRIECEVSFCDTTTEQCSKDEQEQSYQCVEFTRRQHGCLPLMRSKELERKAHKHASTMARKQVVQQSVADVQQLKRKLGSKTVGENVQRGYKARCMHETTMKNHAVNRNNILGLNIKEFGVAVVRGQDELFYLCQYFR